MQRLAALAALSLLSVWPSHLHNDPRNPDVARAAARPAPTARPAGPAAKRRDPIVYVQTTVASVPVKVVYVNLNDPAVKVTAMLAADGSGSTESWSSMITRARPDVAVTGTYFDVATALPVGDIVIDGTLEHFGGRGTALCITADNSATFRKAPLYRHVDWGESELVLRAGPRLVWEGRASVHPRAEGFRDPAVLGRAGRVAVGVTRGGKLVIAVTRRRITLLRLASVMKALGAWNAINLDAGRSMGLYVHGKTVVRPRRRLTNLLLVYTDGRVEAVDRGNTGASAG
ncbi:MAG: phosphodiester glycosidase family protein [Chthonomonadales bacterium]|nr:phosphodiester glycosidase family protein [Chthonomonadales bacterium]